MRGFHTGACCALTLLVLLASPEGRAEEPAVSGGEAMRRAEDLLYRIQDQSAVVTLKTIQPNGRERTHKTRWFWKNFDRRGGVDSKAILDRKSTRLNSSHIQKSRMPSSA